MFQNLFNLGYTRTKKEAFGFYIAYLLLTMFLGALFAGLVVLLMGVNEAEAFEQGVRVGTYIAVAVSVIMSFMVVRAKHLSSHFGYMLLSIGAGFIALGIGGIGGLIPVAYLTTRESKIVTESATPQN